MIVIAIIGILVGVGVPAWRNAVIAGNETAAIQNLRNIATEERTYFNMNGRNGYATFDQLRSAIPESFAGNEARRRGLRLHPEARPSRRTARPPSPSTPTRRRKTASGRRASVTSTSTRTSATPALTPMAPPARTTRPPAATRKQRPSERARGRRLTLPRALVSIPRPSGRRDNARLAQW